MLHNDGLCPNFEDIVILPFLNINFIENILNCPKFTELDTYQKYEK